MRTILFVLVTGIIVLAFTLGHSRVVEYHNGMVEQLVSCVENPDCLQVK